MLRNKETMYVYSLRCWRRDSKRAADALGHRKINHHVMEKVDRDTASQWGLKSKETIIQGICAERNLGKLVKCLADEKIAGHGGDNSLVIDPVEELKLHEPEVVLFSKN